MMPNFEKKRGPVPALRINKPVLENLKELWPRATKSEPVSK
jgi:hypothetical protein